MFYHRSMFDFNKYFFACDYPHLVAKNFCKISAVRAVDTLPVDVSYVERLLLLYYESFLRVFHKICLLLEMENYVFAFMESRSNINCGEA